MPGMADTQFCRDAKGALPPGAEGSGKREESTCEAGTESLSGRLRQLAPLIFSI